MSGLFPQTLKVCKRFAVIFFLNQVKDLLCYDEEEQKLSEILTEARQTRATRSREKLEVGAT
jgi:hypothetical protein